MDENRFKRALLGVGSLVVLACVAYACGTESTAGSTADGGDSSDASGSGSGDGRNVQDAQNGDSDSPTEPVRFVMLGDTGKGNQGQQDVADAVQAKCTASPCDFVVLLGDNIYESGPSSVDDAQWQDKFEKPYANINKTFYAVLGNHDYGGNGAGNEHDKGQISVDYTQKSAKWMMPAPYYRFKKGNVEFFVLDTNAQMYNRAAQQATDVAAWVRDSKARWKIALGHHPYLSNGPHGNAGNYDGLPSITPVFAGKGVKEFFDGVVCGKLDVYFSGHDHSRQALTDSCQGTRLIVDGTGASATSLPGSNPAQFQSLSLGFVYVEIQGDTLKAEFVDVKGTVEHVETITHP